MYFEKIILVGSGDVACFCSNFLNKLAIKHVVIETEQSPLSMLSYSCKKGEIEKIDLFKYRNLDDAIINLALGKTLVISANNRFIFKDCLQENITIINFHYGLIQNYRGMNIPTWVIFNGEKYTGPTWHFVSSAVDAGEIIAQDKFEIFNTDTAFTVTKKNMKLGEELFVKFIQEFLNEPIKFKNNQPLNCISKVYKSYELPNDGVLSMSQNAIAMMRLLRAFDYGKIKYVPPLKFYENGVCFDIVDYGFLDKVAKKRNVDDKILEFIKDKIVFTLILRAKHNF